MPQPPDQPDDLARQLREHISVLKRAHPEATSMTVMFEELEPLIYAVLAPPPLPRDVAELVRRLRAPIDSTGRLSGEQVAPLYSELHLQAADALESLARKLAEAQISRDRIIIDLVIERAEQACRYALKHQTFEGPDGEYRSGWEVAADVCEHSIKRHVNYHISQDILDSIGGPQDG